MPSKERCCAQLHHNQCGGVRYEPMVNRLVADARAQRSSDCGEAFGQLMERVANLRQRSERHHINELNFSSINF
jgi:hypothetical protein